VREDAPPDGDLGGRRAGEPAAGDNRRLRRVAVTGTALLACASALLVPAGSTAVIAAALLVFGAGMGGAAVSAQIAALTGVAEEHSGLAAGLVDTSPPSPRRPSSAASVWPPP
jgi:predicted MFS family arabinose efflux permease